MLARFNHVVDRRDPRVIQRRRSACLGQNTGAAIALIYDIVEHQLQCHIAVQQLIARAVHYAHSAAAQFRRNQVMREGVANHEVTSAEASLRSGPVIVNPGAMPEWTGAS